jgi:anti-sigma factor RsiW
MSEKHEMRARTIRPRACANVLRQVAGSGTLTTSVESHLQSCTDCADEVRRERLALAALRNAAAALSSDARESGADAFTPARRLLLDSTVRRPGLGWGLLPLLDWRPAMGVAAAALVALTLGLGAKALTPDGPQADTGLRLASVVAGTDLQVVADGSAVTLSWKSDGRPEHRVIRATDPRDLAAGRTEVVRGSQWVDPDTNGSKVVFYVVE